MSNARVSIVFSEYSIPLAGSEHLFSFNNIHLKIYTPGQKFIEFLTEMKVKQNNNFSIQEWIYISIFRNCEISCVWVQWSWFNAPKQWATLQNFDVYLKLDCSLCTNNHGHVNFKQFHANALLANYLNFTKWWNGMFLYITLKWKCRIASSSAF